MGVRSLVAAGCGVLQLLSVAEAGDRVSVEAASGTALSLPLTLTIDQRGHQDLAVDARWETRPFDDAPYYSWRIGLWSGASAWELQLVHHKVYLENPPPEIQRFEVTHGYNMFTIGKLWSRGRSLVRAGAGFVLAHPESTVRGQAWPGTGGLSPGVIGLLGEGYFLTGPVVRGSIGRRLGHKLFLAPELELTAARARVPIADGEASVPNIALHLRLAVGVRF